MKFETILDALITVAEDLGEMNAAIGTYYEFEKENYNCRLRQLVTFRARLERMYKLKGATSLERAMGLACDELGLDYIFIDEIVSDPLPRG